MNKLLTAAFIMQTIGALLGGAAYLNAKRVQKHPFNKPYMIFLMDITEEDLVACRADIDCLDIMLIDDLPSIDPEGETEANQK